jgi:hypothetical protein
MIVSVFLGCAFLLSLGSAHAQGQPVAPPSPSVSPFPGSVASPATASPRISQAQFESFAELIGEPRPLVWQRLQLDPGLVPLAAAAGDARMSRKSSGKTRTIVGFSIFGAGLGVGYLIFLSSVFDGVNCNNSYNDTCATSVGSGAIAGLLLMVISSAVGLGIGIPGIVSMARQSEAETAAVDRYQYPLAPQPPSPYYYPGQSSMPASRAFKMPLLSLSF